MDSINREQPELNRADLSGANAIERLRDTAKENVDLLFLHRRQHRRLASRSPDERARGGRRRRLVDPERVR